MFICLFWLLVVVDVVVVVVVVVVGFVGVLSTAADPLLPLLGVSFVMVGFAWTCTVFDRVQIRTQVNAIFSPFGLPTLVDTSQSQVICMCVKCTAFCDLRELVSRLTNSFGHPSQVRTQVLVLQTCEFVWPGFM